MRVAQLLRSMLLLYTAVIVNSYSYCNCDVNERGFPTGWNYNDIWLDVVVILDTSEAMGKTGLKSASGLIESFFRIGSHDVLITATTAPFYTRVGVISMSSKAEVLYNLNMTKMDNLTDKASIKKGMLDIDVLDAFKAALKMFNDGLMSKPERRNTRKVIYYMTNADPLPNLNPVNQFKASKGVVIVNNFLKLGDVELSALQEIASPGYYFTNPSYSAVLQAFCKANCFCEPELTGFPGSDPAVKAAGGCYYPNPEGRTFNTAKHTCSNGGGILSTIHDEEKGRFIKEIMANEGVSDDFWIGLERVEDGEWKWADQSNKTYTNWADKEPNMDKLAKCAYMNPKEPQMPWSAGNCKRDLPFVCEYKPCSVGHKNCFNQVKKGDNNINQN